MNLSTFRPMVLSSTNPHPTPAVTCWERPPPRTSVPLRRSGAPSLRRSVAAALRRPVV
ncbi:MAG: hypothetical protein IT376_06960 [Polyangiaceae bacterium]|nr:hypothetical protein [Polyangiaceae bacterium]